MNDQKIPDIAPAFAGKKALIGFLTAGDPSLACTAEFILEMERAGTDLIEIGIPFSDPVAEGEVIQRSDARALHGGATIDGIFDMVSSIRSRSPVPLLFLTYINPVFVYGYERFLKRCAETGIAGLIIPDLPFEERGEIAGAAARHGIRIITLISPVSGDRVRRLAKSAEGFVYLVSSLGVTGIRKSFSKDLSEIVAEVRKETDTPVAIGFGVSSPEQAAEMAGIADGVIIGSAIVRIIEKHRAGAAPFLYSYLSSVRAAIDGGTDRRAGRA